MDDRRALHELQIAEAVELLGIGRILSKLKTIGDGQTAIARRLTRIERAINAEGAIMSEVDDRLAALTEDLGDLATDLDRELTDLKGALAGNLTAEQAASFDTLVSKVADMKAAIDDADPAAPAAPAEPTA